MEQHSIPQQISSYEFKLVGEMTLKQFLKAAGGIILAILINTTKLIGIVKWPLMILCVGTGLLFAFVPFEDRPLEVWIKAFIKSIYSPTFYIYKKKIDHSWLKLSMKKNEENQNEDNKNEVIEKNKIEKEEQKNGIFLQTKVTKQRKETIEEDEEKKVKKINKANDLIETRNSPSETKKEENVKKDEVEIQENSWKNQKADLNLQSEKLGATGQAVFGAIPMPDRPEIPNLIVGMATTKEGKIIDGVIIEIQDEHGSSSRVLKTNSLGQFKISTPLDNGRYLIIADKDGYFFDRVNVDLNGQIVEPIRIIAHN